MLELTRSSSEIIREPLPSGDPTRRQPDITLAQKALDRQPSIPLRVGLERTIAHFEQVRRHF